MSNYGFLDTMKRAGKMIKSEVAIHNAKVKEENIAALKKHAATLTNVAVDYENSAKTEREVREEIVRVMQDIGNRFDITRYDLR